MILEPRGLTHAKQILYSLELYSWPWEFSLTITIEFVVVCVMWTPYSYRSVCTCTCVRRHASSHVYLPQADADPQRNMNHQCNLAEGDPLGISLPCIFEIGLLRAGGWGWGRLQGPSAPLNTVLRHPSHPCFTERKRMVTRVQPLCCSFSMPSAYHPSLPCPPILPDLRNHRNEVEAAHSFRKHPRWAFVCNPASWREKKKYSLCCC